MTTMKKLYTKPSLEVVMLQRSDLIATSGDLNTVTLDLDFENSEAEGIAD